MNDKLSSDLTAFHKDYKTNCCLITMLEKLKLKLDKVNYVGTVLMDLL